MLKNVTGYSKRAGDHPGNVDCSSKLYSSTTGPEEKNSLSVRSALIVRRMSSALIREEEEGCQDLVYARVLWPSYLIWRDHKIFGKMTFWFL